MSRLVRQKSPQISNTLLDIPKKPLWAPAEPKKKLTNIQRDIIKFWNNELRATDHQIKMIKNSGFDVADTTTEYLSNLKKILLLCKFKFEKSKELLKEAQEAIQAKNVLAQENHIGFYSGNQNPNPNPKLTELKHTIDVIIGNLLRLYEQDKEELDQTSEKKCSIM